MAAEIFSSHNLEQLIQGLVRREYDLLLGAGSSLGAIGGDGNPLPDARNLASELLEFFEIRKSDIFLDLKLAYEIVKQEKNKNGKTVKDYLVSRFTNCQPMWQRILSQFEWNRVWTLNIDDVIEKAYQESGVSYSQRAIPLSWTSQYKEPDRIQNELQIIHLHGKVAGSGADDDIVFSILEYLQASAKQHVWHRIFGDEFLQKPFVVVGARLTDEYDLADILRRGNHSLETTGRPSIVVLRSVDEMQKRLFQQWGLNVIKDEAEGFFRQLLSLMSEQEKKTLKLLKMNVENLPTEIRVFLQQFVSLRDDIKTKAPASHDFYSGDEPIWEDILKERDAIFEITDKVVSGIEVNLQASPSIKKQSVNIIFGPAGSGKSSSLLRIGREFLRKGLDVFLFRGEEQIEISAVVWWLENSQQKSILLIDGVADFAYDIKRLLQECSRKNLTCVIVGCERQNRADYIFNIMPVEFLRDESKHVLETLTNHDIDNLIDVLKKRKRLGILTRKSHEEQQKYFRLSASRQLLTAMADLEGGRGHIARIETEYTMIKDQTLQDIYCLACMTYSFGYPLPFGIAIIASGVKPQSLTEALSSSGELSGILKQNKLGILPRHRVIANILITKILNGYRNYQLSLSLAKSLSPHVNQNTLRQETLHSRIIKILMDSEVVYGWMGIKHAGDWYEELQEFYSWNSRFWEQRALTEARLKQFPKARSFAEEAVRINHHPYPLNTLGTVLVRMAIEYMASGTVEGENLFWEGVKNLQASAELASYESLHPFRTFFTYTIAYVKRNPSKLYTASPIAREWYNWMTRAKKVPSFRHQEMLDEFDEYQRQWLHLAAR